MLPMKSSTKEVIAVVGLGYVGLPIVVAFAEKGRNVIGFDISERKVKKLKNGIDENNEHTKEEISSKLIQFTTNPRDLRKADFIIVAVPTPVDGSNQPDLTPVVGASTIVGKNLKKGAIVVFESTVYPGVTEEICQPIIEKESKMKAGKDWKIGYSPERINPGDKDHHLRTVVKVVSGMDKSSSEKIEKIYQEICDGGVYRASSIKVAEASKIIENTQRDINIALVNELAMIFERLGINTKEVIEAAGTKWNFHKYTPGLVGGHCIGVDPYYLVHRAEQHSLHPNLIATGRRVNDGMAEYVAHAVVRGLIDIGKTVKQSRVLIAGLAFKEDVNDFRNSKSLDIAKHLIKFGIKVEGYDPHLEPDSHLENPENVTIIAKPHGKYDAIVFPIYHKIFDEKLAPNKLEAIANNKTLVFDVKSKISTRKLGKTFFYKSL